LLTVTAQRPIGRSELLKAALSGSHPGEKDARAMNVETRLQLKDPIAFCPAAGCAAAIVRLEGFIDNVAQLYVEAERARAPDLMRQLEAISGELIQAADEARDRLAAVEATSSAGAMAQLLAAIRDLRVRDDAERERAKNLEAKAIGFLADAHLYDAHVCSVLSQTKLGSRLPNRARRQTGQQRS
jgi:hypothetical protein